MVITEIFKSIQGESTYSGRPCIFVWLTGCNLRCRWCDTAYAFYGGTRLSVEEVLARVQALTGDAGQQRTYVFDELEPPVLGGWILRDRLPVRLGLQLHKFIWDPEARGV